MTQPKDAGAIAPVEIAEEGELVAIPPQDESHDDALAPDMMDAMITVAAKVDRYDKAMTTILNAVLKRTYAGDWVSHDRFTVPVKLRTASPSGPGCERIAAFLGISERNWTGGDKFWIEEGKHFGYRFEADFTLGGRTVRGVGEVTTKNKFFSYSKEEGWKELSDVREDHVRKAAMRDCSKDGVRRLLGLRKIPIQKLNELGFDLNLVHFVNFKTLGEAMQEPGAPPAGQQRPAAAQPQAAKPPTFLRTFTVVSRAAKKDKNDKTYFTFTGRPVPSESAADAFPFSVFAGIESDRIKALVAAQDSEAIVTAEFVQNGNYLNLETIKEVTPK